MASEEKLQLYINNEKFFQDYSNIWTFENGIKQIKYLKENDKISFEINTSRNPELIYVYASKDEDIQKVFDKKDSNYFTDIEMKKNGLTGMAHFKDDGYLSLSIAYDNLWKIYVDGEETKAEAIAGAFLGAKLDKGVHKIEIKAN